MNLSTYVGPMYRKHLEGPLSRLPDIAEQSREGEAAFFFFLFLFLFFWNKYIFKR